MSESLVRTLIPGLLLLAAAYALLVAYTYFFQSRLLFYPQIPGRALAATPASVGLEFEELRLTAGDGASLHAWHVPASTAGSPVVLFCHGNAGNISHRLDWAELFHRMGMAVLLFDYRGYGESSGTPDERGTYQDARAAWDYLTKVKGYPPQRIVIFGESLGAAIASQLASEVTPGALILLSGFISVPELASRFYWYLPVKLIARFEYPTAEYLARVRAPVLVMHSRADEITPFAHGTALFARANDPKQFLELRGDHNSALLLNQPRLETVIADFLMTRGLLASGT